MFVWPGWRGIDDYQLLLISRNNNGSSCHNRSSGPPDNGDCNIFHYDSTYNISRGNCTCRTYLQIFDGLPVLVL